MAWVRKEKKGESRTLPRSALRFLYKEERKEREKRVLVCFV
jgi:hypothetical protein